MSSLTNTHKSHKTNPKKSEITITTATQSHSTPSTQSIQSTTSRHTKRKTKRNGIENGRVPRSTIEKTNSSISMRHNILNIDKYNQISKSGKLNSENIKNYK